MTPLVNPFGQLLGWRLISRENGASRYELDVRPEHMNPNRVLHGGVIFSLADNGMGSALTTLLGEHEQCATVQISLVFLRAVTAGTLVCETRVLQKGSRVAFLESEVKNGEQVVARVQGTFSIFPRRSK